MKNKEQINESLEVIDETITDYNESVSHFLAGAGYTRAEISKIIQEGRVFLQCHNSSLRVKLSQTLYVIKYPKPTGKEPPMKNRFKEILNDG